MAVGVAFSPSFIVFVILEFFVGAAHHGGFMICCVLSTLEFTLILIRIVLTINAKQKF
jgi:hypothetical protein